MQTYTKFFITTLLCLLITIKCDLGQVFSVNSCGNLGYSKPSNPQDCVATSSSGSCCYVNVPSLNLSYCAFLPGELRPTAIDLFKKEFGVPSEIVCASRYLSWTMALLFIMTFIF